MIPKTYRHNKLLRDFQDKKYALIQRDDELHMFLDMVGFPKNYKHLSITGMVSLIVEGDIEAVWVTTYNKYYMLDTWYQPLPYYRPGHWIKRNLPDYWKEENLEYQQEIIK